MENKMAINQHSLIVSILCIASLFFGVYLLRWTILGLLKGRIRYRLKEYDRFKSPMNFWLALIWGFSVGIFFSFGALLSFFLGVIKQPG